jgi:hypothetical protein
MKDLFGRDQDASPPMPLNRRRALLAMGVMGACAVTVAFIPQWRRVISPGRPVDAAALAKALVPLSRDERAALGRAISSLDASRNYTRELAASLGSLVVLNGSSLLGPRDIDRLVAPLSQRSRDDFAKGRVIMIDRWYLSRTQCDVLAMAAAASGAPAIQIGAAS